MELSSLNNPENEAHVTFDEDIQPMTIRRIAEYVGKSYDWVQARVENFPDEIIELPDANNHLRINYSRKAILALKAEADSTRKYPTVGAHDISLYGLSTVLGRKEKWIQARMLILGIEPIDKLNPVNNRIFGYYDEEEDLEPLRKEDERMKSYPIASEGYSTVEGLAAVMGHSNDPGWVRRRLRYIAIMPTMMMNPLNNVLGLYFPTQQTAQQIRSLPRHYRRLRPYPMNIIHPSEADKRPELVAETDVIEDWQNSIDKSPLPMPKTADTLDWMQDALCAEIDPDLFSAPDRGGSHRKAKEICGQCAVRLFCLEYALVNDVDSGIYGGLSPKERKALNLELKALGELA